jgi:hypothetical protein
MINDGEIINSNDPSTEEAHFRFNSLGTDVTETVDGPVVRFVCCNQETRFGPNGDPEEIGREILNHQLNCDPSAQRVDGVRCGACGRLASEELDVRMADLGARCRDARSCLAEMARRKMVAAYQTGGERATIKQGIAMAVIAASQRINLINECERITGFPPDALSVTASSVFIDLLRSAKRREPVTDEGHGDAQAASV